MKPHLAILVQISRVNLEEHSPKVDTVRQSPINLVGQDGTKSEYSTISNLLQNTVPWHFFEMVNPFFGLQ